MNQQVRAFAVKPEHLDLHDGRKEPAPAIGPLTFTPVLWCAWSHIPTNTHTK